MARLSKRDERRVDEVIAAIGEIREDGARAIEVALPMVRELVEAPFVGSYRTDRSESGVCLEWERGAGIRDDAARERLRPFFQRMSAGRGPWDLSRPPPKQRNRAVVFPWKDWGLHLGPDALAASLRDHAARVGTASSSLADAALAIWRLNQGMAKLGTTLDYNLRVLVCDGDVLINLIGFGQAEPVRERQRLLLQKLVQPLRERLIVERRAGGGLAHEAMMAALEHVPAAAFLLDARGNVLHANSVGRHRLDTQGSAMRLALRRALNQAPGARGELALTQLVGPGLPPLFLAVSGTHGDRVRFGIERARKRWQLTSREVEVLAQLAAGRTNQDIADQLGCAPRTVEIHVSSLLRKAHADSRSQLIVDLWHLADQV
jgi:DNA-binding CsgD family transcriptional regulator